MVTTINKQEEEVLRRRFRSKGLQLILKEEMSAVNKKIDVRLKVAIHDMSAR